MLFSTFSRQYLGFKNNQNQDYINHNLLYVYYNRSFLNLNHWLLEKSEVINLQMMIQKSTFNVLSSCCPFEKTCSAMSTSISLAWTPFWHMRKPGIYSCENVPGISTTLRSASTFYTSTERLTRLNLLKCAFT